jgi:hypothetical protein
MTRVPSPWHKVSPHALSAALWPAPNMRSATPGGHSCDPALTATGFTSLSGLLEAMPADLKERLRPTHLRDQLRCGYYAKFRREWQPRWVRGAPGVAEIGVPFTALGTAIHGALAAHLRGAPTTLGHDLQEAWVGNDDAKWTMAKVAKLAQRAVDEAIGVLPREEILSSERRLFLGQPDLVTAYGPTDQLAVTDFKVHWSSKAERYTEEWDTDLQLWAYTDEAERFFGRRVAWRRVLEIIMTPKVKATLVPFKVTPARLEFMRPVLRSATRYAIEVWQGAPPTPDTFNCWRYGRCVAYEACHDFAWDPEQMGVLYDQL